MNWKRILSIYLAFWLGLFLGGIIDYFLGFNKPGISRKLSIPDYSLFINVIEINLTFAIIIFIVQCAIIQRIIILFISTFLGEVAFKSGIILGLVGILPHGLIETLGLSFIAYAGQNYKENTHFIKPLILGIILIFIAAFIESSITLYILQEIYKEFYGEILSPFS
jgi:hypothetical protein